MALVIAFLFLLKPVLPVAEYLANYTYIAKELCENRARPQLHCNGKCHLMKQLAKASEHEKPLSDKKQGTAEQDLVLFFEAQAPVFSHFTANDTNKELNLFYHNFYSRLSASFLLRPPVV